MPRGCSIIIALTSLLCGCENPQDANKPLDQSKIVSVRPAIPEGARKFVEQQRKLEEQRRRNSKQQAAQPPGYTFEPAASPKPANDGRGSGSASPDKQDKASRKKTTQAQPAAPAS